MTDLFYSKGTSHKYWGAARDGRVVHTAWGRIGATLQTKAYTLRTPLAAAAEYAALVAKKRTSGYADARPVAGSLTFVAAKHQHADIVYIDASGELSCSVCNERLSSVQVAPAPIRRPPGPSTTKKRPSVSLPPTEMVPVPGIEFQLRFVWPLAAALRPGTKLSAAKLIDRVRAAVEKDAIGRAANARLRASEVPVWRASAKLGKPSDLDRIGGSPSWLGADQWPACGDCGQEMVFLAQLRAGPGTGIPLRVGRRIYLFECVEHCWGNAERAVVVQPNSDPASGHEPDADVVKLRALALTFTRSTEPRRPSEWWIPNESERIAAALLYFPFGRDVKLGPTTWPPRSGRVAHDTKLGGHPQWIQREDDGGAPGCGVCKKPMRFAAQIDSMMHPSLWKGDVPSLLGDAGAGYLFLCTQDEQGHFQMECS